MFAYFAVVLSGRFVVAEKKYVVVAYEFNRISFIVVFAGVY